MGRIIKQFRFINIVGASDGRRKGKKKFLELLTGVRKAKKKF
jgi:hypothetical protein